MADSVLTGIPVRVTQRITRGSGDARAMTHEAEQPNQAKPYVDAAKRYYEDAKAFASGGVAGVLKHRGVPMPAWSDKAGEIAHGLGDAASMSLPIGGAALGAMSSVEAEKAFREMELRYSAGKIKHVDEHPQGADVEDHEIEGDDGHTYRYSLSFDKQGRSIDAHVSDIERTDHETDESLPFSELSPVQAYKARKAVESQVRGDLEDEADLATEEARIARQSPAEREAEANAEQVRAEHEDRERRQAIERDVDAALARGWRPEVNEHGGWKRPPEIARWASPASQQKVKEALAARGISLEPPGREAQ